MEVALGQRKPTCFPDCLAFAEAEGGQAWPRMHAQMRSFSSALPYSKGRRVFLNNEPLQHLRYSILTEQQGITFRSRKYSIAAVDERALRRSNPIETP